MSYARLSAVFLLIVSPPLLAQDRSADPLSAFSPPSREFRFDYRFSIVDLPANTKLRIWIPAPTDRDEQAVTTADSQSLAAYRETADAVYGNRILYREAVTDQSGAFQSRLAWNIVRREVRSPVERPSPTDATATRASNPKLSLRPFLKSNSRVPITGRPIELLKEMSDNGTAVEKMRLIYEKVDRHVAYDKSGKGWGQGDVLWVCDSGTGNCTDFHSLFISLARSQSVPARFEIGFSVPTDEQQKTIGGYHCWAWFHDNQRGWIPVDISEADKHPEMKDYYFGNLTANRVAFSTGRDIELVPKQNGPPLNFFVYPHVEVDGKLLSSKHVRHAFSWSSR